MYPSTLYEVADVPEDVPPQMVRAAALVTGEGAGTVSRRAALEVLSRPEARADYDARQAQGLAFELALAWGVAAFSASDISAARDHFARAARIAPDDRAVPILLAATEEAPEEPAGPLDSDLCAAAREEIEHVRQNSAFPHRLLRYAAALASEPEQGVEGSGMMAGAARELLQYDVVEAPRAYAMILPVLQEHYPSVYALDEPFFDAAMAVLARHTPAAEYERGKRQHASGRTTGSAESAEETGAPPRMEMPIVELPRLRYQDRRLNLALLPRPGYAWVGAVIGALVLMEDGPEGMAFGAILGFIIAYLLLLAFRRRR